MCETILNEDTLVCMLSKFNFFKTFMPGTRKADIYLGCLDGSVILDFNISNENMVTLVRVSFDGYGCCNLRSTGQSLNVQDSLEFLIEFKKN